MSYFNYNSNLKKYLKHQFQNINLVKTNFSQMQQDMFVVSVLDGKINGTFVDIGAHDPIGVNNTYLLETAFGWKGLSFELDANLSNKFNLTRKTPCICADATNIDYVEILAKHNINLDIDYLSVDIEPPNLTFVAMRKILEAGLRPTVITFEHEAMNGVIGQTVRTQSREYLKDLGYTLMVKDISNLGVGSHDLGVPYNVEDWWVIKEKINPDIFEKLKANDVEYICSVDTVYDLSNYSVFTESPPEISLISSGIGNP